MKKLIFLVFFIGCTSIKSFYTDNVKDGLDIAKTYQWQVIKIDTLKNSTFIIHYKDLPEVSE